MQRGKRKKEIESEGKEQEEEVGHVERRSKKCKEKEGEGR